MSQYPFSPRAGWRSASKLPSPNTRLQIADGWYAVRRPGPNAATFDLEGDAEDAVRITGQIEDLDLRLEIAAFDDLDPARLQSVRLSFENKSPADQAATQPAKIGFLQRIAGGTAQMLFTVSFSTTRGNGTVIAEAWLSDGQRARLKREAAALAASGGQLFLTVSFATGPIDGVLSGLALGTEPRPVVNPAPRKARGDADPGAGTGRAAPKARLGAAPSDSKTAASRFAWAGAGSAAKPLGGNGKAGLAKSTSAKSTSAKSKSDGAKPSVSSSPFAERARQLYQADDLFGLHDHCALAGEDVPRADVFAARILLGRLYLRLNASETAYRLFELLAGELAAEPAALGASAMRQFRMLLARAASRTGRIGEAETLLTEAIAAKPTEWEPYFQLGNLRGGEQRLALYAAARACSAKLTPAVQTAMIEAMIEGGRLSEALAECTSAVSEGLNPEFCATFANAFLALGDRRAWAIWIEKYFRKHELAGFAFRPEPEPIALFGIEPPALPPSRFTDEVSVVMTSFNAAATIEMAIRSVLAQTHAALRLYVVDDCSTDHSREIVASIAQEDPRVLLRVNTTNSGTYISKNSAMAESDTPFVTFHDSDDWMHPQRIERHLEAMHADPRVLCSLSRWIRMNEAGFVVVRKAGGYLHDNPASTFFRRETIERCGYFDSVRTGADSEYLWRVQNRFGKSAVARLSRPLAIGLHHEHSLTTKGAAAFDENRYSPVRLAYWEAWVNWQLSQRHDPSLLHVPLSAAERRFAAPPEILPHR